VTWCYQVTAEKDLKSESVLVGSLCPCVYIFSDEWSGTEMTFITSLWSGDFCNQLQFLFCSELC